MNFTKKPSRSQAGASNSEPRDSGASKRSAESTQSKASMILRIRTQLGIWRIGSISPYDDFGRIKARLEEEHFTDLTGRSLTRDIEGKEALLDTQTVKQAGLKHGDMLFLSVDESKTGVHENALATSKRITKDGHIVAQQYSNISQQSGFRPGMLPLGAIKKQWTLAEYVRLDEQFEYRLKAPEASYCKGVFMDTPAMENFFAYVRSLDFKQMRVGYLYGTVDATERTVKVEYIYEPPQDTTSSSFSFTADAMQNKAECISALLGLKKVGWIFAHPPREEGFFFSAQEVLTAAEQQLEDFGGVPPAPASKEEPTAGSLFVTVKVTLDLEGKPLVDAWQICRQGLEMAAEGALQPSVHLGHSLVSETFTAYVEGKPVKEVDNNFFITRVGINKYSSKFLSTFPRLNRLTESHSANNLREQISKSGTQGWTMKDLLADFQLLLFLTTFYGEQDMQQLCQCILNPEIPLEGGYVLFIRSIAGLS